MSLTKDFWKNIKNYQVYISEITIEEINLIANKKLKFNFLKLIKSLKILKISSEIKMLAEAYLEANIIPREYINDALQIATASVNKLDLLLSWNFRHMVNKRVETKVNAINVLYNFPKIDIAAPGELL